MSGGITPIKFTPQARPVDTVGVDTSFQRMAAPVERHVNPLRNPPAFAPTPPENTTGRTQALVEALAGFTRSASQIGSQYDQEQAEKLRLEAEFDAVKMQALSWEQAVKQNPALADKSPFYREVFTARIAENAAIAKMRELDNEYVNSPLVNSTNPADGQKWLTEKMDGWIDQFTDPSARAAAIKVLNQRAQTFLSDHATNARTNLIKKNQQGFAVATGTAIDDEAAMSVAQPYDSGPPTGVDEAIQKAGLPPEARAFIHALMPGENAGGQFNITYGGHKFDINGPHPNMKIPIESGPNKGQTSSAAGLGQFIYGTWLDVWGGENRAMTPENQVMAIWINAQKNYKGNLLEDLKKNGLTVPMMRQLGGQWEAWRSYRSGPEKLARYAATYRKALGDAGVEAPGDSREPNLQAITENIYADADRQRSIGVTDDVVDNTIVNTVITKAYQYRDPTYLNILKYSRNGQKSLYDRPEVAEKVHAAVDRIQARVMQDDNQRAASQQAARAAAIASKRDELYSGALAAMRSGEDPSFSTEQILTAEKVSRELGEDLRRINKSYEEGRTVKASDESVNEVWREIYDGKLNMEGLFKALGDKRITDPQVFKSMADEIQQNKAKHWLTGEVFKSQLRTLDDYFRNDLEDRPDLAARKDTVASELRRNFSSWMERNPDKVDDLEAQTNFLEKTRFALLRAHIPQFKDAVQSGNTEAPVPKSAFEDGAKPTTPVEAPATAAPGQQAWREKPVVKDFNTLRQMVAEYAQSGGKAGQLIKIFEIHGIRSEADQNEFIRAQKILLQRSAP